MYIFSFFPKTGYTHFKVSEITSSLVVFESKQKEKQANKLLPATNRVITAAQLHSNLFILMFPEVQVKMPKR